MLPCSVVWVLGVPAARFEISDVTLVGLGRGRYNDGRFDPDLVMYAVQIIYGAKTRASRGVLSDRVIMRPDEDMRVHGSDWRLRRAA